MENLWTKECAICGKKCGRGSNALSNHVSEHDISLENYYKKYVNKTVENLCETCGDKTPFSLRFKRFNRFCTRKCQAIEVSNRPEQKEIMRGVMIKTLSRLNGDKSYQQMRSETALKTIADPNNGFGSPKKIKIA